MSSGGWEVRKIAVVGAGIVGVPMAALLAHSRIKIGVEKPASVVVIQRPSQTSGWKVGAINAGCSPIGGLEPDLDTVVAQTRREGLLSASHDSGEIIDSDAILFCVQTDKKGSGPDYGPLEEALSAAAQALGSRPRGRPPVLIFESTLAPTTMMTWARDYFEKTGLREGQDILLGNSPNRVMPGFLVERIRTSDKLVGGLCQDTAERIKNLYSSLVTAGRLHLCNSLTAEVVKTLENAYRDVRIAYTSEVARECDLRDISFSTVREEVNSMLGWSDQSGMDPAAIPFGGLLLPTIGVGGHCLPKDGILLLWRKLEAGYNPEISLILQSRRINDSSPYTTVENLEKLYGRLSGKTIALMGVAYRPNSEDTRNSPSLVLGRALKESGCRVVLHDPYVRRDDANLAHSGLADVLTSDLNEAVTSSDLVVFAVAHRLYAEEMEKIRTMASNPGDFYDGCRLFPAFPGKGKDADIRGIGRGEQPPSRSFIRSVYTGFRDVERGFALEIKLLLDFLNDRYVTDEFNRLNFLEVKELAGTCSTGCRIAEPGPMESVPSKGGFVSRLVQASHDLKVQE